MLLILDQSRQTQGQSILQLNIYIYNYTFGEERKCLEKNNWPKVY